MMHTEASQTLLLLSWVPLLKVPGCVPWGAYYLLVQLLSHQTHQSVQHLLYQGTVLHAKS